jgi:predicted ATP-binding protein involved in virulence
MNDDVFITSIEVKKVRNIENFTIPLSETERKHLIITGKNGSGKTSLLSEINKFLGASNQYSYGHLESWKEILDSYKKSLESTQSDRKKEELKSSIENLERQIGLFGNILIYIKNGYSIKSYCEKGFYLLTFFESKRIVSPNIPKGINKVDLKNNYPLNEKINQNFIQYIVNLKAERSFANDDNDSEAVVEIDTWFENFEDKLKDLFDAPDLQLIFDRKNYNFYIQISNNEPFSLNQLSDGYSAALSIVTELILRMEATGNKAHDQQGIVLIDEIETHLHLALQKKIMPFLCAFFPNIQFIITTHSPFVISSLKNAVVCDLEKREVISEDLTGYSYEALVESYFDTDEYSQEIKEKLYRYKFLSEKEELTDDEEDEYDDLEDYFDNLPKFRAATLAAEAERIGLKKMMRKG